MYVSFNRCTGDCTPTDHVTVSFTNDSGKQYVRLVLAPFEMTKQRPTPPLLSVHPAAISHTRHTWLFQLAPHRSSVVKFTFIHTSADYYCAAGHMPFNKCRP
jgi:hypothetical protein